MAKLRAARSAAPDLEDPLQEDWDEYEDESSYSSGEEYTQEGDEALGTAREEGGEREKHDDVGGGTQCASRVSTHEARPFPLQAQHGTSPRVSEEGKTGHGTPCVL